MQAFRTVQQCYFTSAQPVGVITPGMLVTAAAGIAANTSIVGVTHGQGVLTGATLSQNSNALINPLQIYVQS